MFGGIVDLNLFGRAELNGTATTNRSAVTLGSSLRLGF